MAEIAEDAPIQIRQGAESRNIEILFEGRWLGLCTMGTTSFGMGFDTSPESQPQVNDTNERYRALVEQCSALLLAAPTMLETLKHVEALLRRVAGEVKPLAHRELVESVNLRSAQAHAAIEDAERRQT